MTIDSRLTTALAGRYRLERELGQGGMATVYLAEDLRHHRNVAVKVLRPDLAATMGPERFAREIEVAARLQHPHILGLLDSGEAEGFLYYVMPYVEGETLRERLSRTGEFPVPEAVRLMGEIAEALAVAHKHGVVHRDIKPENILLSGRHAMVMDFGVAKAVTEASGRQQLTTAGIALGTPAYMAPEQATADPHLDGRVDIYALGVVGYEMLAGQTPFHGLNPQQTLAAHVTQSPQPLGQLRAGLSPALEAALMKCLAKRPADRYQSADDVVTALEPLATPSGGMTPTYTQPVQAATTATRPFPRWLAWAAGGALVAGGALALTLVRRPEAALAVGKRIAIAVGPDREQWPSLAPDGKTIVFTRTEKGVRHLFVQQVDGGAPLPVTTQLPDWQCCGALSPDGSRLLFLTAQGLYVVPTLGGQARQISTRPVLPGPGARPVFWGSWSPDGQRIAYSQDDTLFTQGTEEKDRIAIAQGGLPHSSAWSSDGHWIAFVRGNPQFLMSGNLAPSTIWVVRVRGGTPIQLTDSLSLNMSPVWVPGRLAMLFISDKDGGRDVYQLNLSSSGKPSGPPVRITTGLNPDRIAVSADGKRLAWSVFTETSNVWSLPIPTRDSVPLSQASQLTTGDQVIETVTASPDGKWLYYDSDFRGNADIWRIPLADGAAAGPSEQITNDPAPEFNPSISPDGKEVAFHSFRTGNRDIFVAPSSGGTAVQVTTSQENDWNARWSPDGRAIAFDQQLSQDSTLWIVRRRPDGSWETPQALPHRGFAALATWSRDGRSIAFSGYGVKVIDLDSGNERSLTDAGPPATWMAWSPDSRSIYYTREDQPRGFIIRVVPAAGGIPKTLVFANAPDRQLHRYGFSAVNGRFYFPLVEQKADVWVAEVEPK